MARQAVGNVMPWRLVDNVNMACRFDAGVIVEAAERQAVIIGMGGKGRNQPRAAAAAKGSVGARRGFVGRNEVLSLEIAKIRGTDGRAGAERGAMRLAAHRTVAIANVPQRTIDFVFDLATQAAAPKHSDLLLADLISFKW